MSSTPPVFNYANFVAQFPAFGAPLPQSLAQLAWNMGANWVSQTPAGYSSDVPSVLGELVGAGNGAQATFVHSVTYLPVVPGTVAVVAGAVTATDDGDGNLTGVGVASGTINYLTGALSITYSAPLAMGVSATLNYSYVNSSASCPWASFGMTAQQLQQAADLMGAVMCKQLYGSAAQYAAESDATTADDAPGAVESATEGSVTANFQLPAIGTSAFASMLLASPPYGRALLALLQVAASVGPYIPSCRPGSSMIPP